MQDVERNILDLHVATKLPLLQVQVHGPVSYLVPMTKMLISTGNLHLALI